MDKNIELLNYVYQNAKMGVDSISHLIEAIDDKKFQQVVAREQKDYQRIVDQAKKLFDHYGKTEKEINAMAKIMSYISIKRKTLTDHSTQHIAKMLTEGSDMGLIEISQNLNKYDGIAPDIDRLANDLLDLEKQNAEELRAYL